MKKGTPLLLLSLILLLLATISRTEAASSFRNDVLPILSKAGCNTGGCHGALAGKGGFRLSLFGYDPEADYLSITRESRGRRVEMADPGASLLLTKPTTALPHKGGKRIPVDSPDYQILASWITAGCQPPGAGDPTVSALTISPPESLLMAGGTTQLTLSAKFSDGTSRDVTPWTKFTSADETVATVSPDGLVTVLAPGEGAITAWYSSQIVIARVVAPWEQQIPAAVYADAPRSSFMTTSSWSS